MPLNLMENPKSLNISENGCVLKGISTPFGYKPLAKSPTFRNDNNRPPVASIDALGVVFSPDQRGGIPVPLVVSDEEEDEVGLVVQWRYESGSFPQLPPSRKELLALLADDEAAGVCLIRFHILLVYTVIADERIGHRDNLPLVRRVSQDFLIPRHGGVKTNLPGDRRCSAKRPPLENGAVLQCEDGFTPQARHRRRDYRLDTQSASAHPKVQFTRWPSAWTIRPTPRCR